MAKPTLEYKIAVDYELEDIESVVNGWLKEGWRPQGGLTVVRPREDVRIYYQALVRDVWEAK